MEIKKPLCIGTAGGVLGIAAERNSSAIYKCFANDVVPALAEGAKKFTEYLFNISPSNDTDLVLSVGAKVVTLAGAAIAYYKLKK